MSGVADLEEGICDRVLLWLRREEPTAVAVLVTGSYARGQASEGSDLDLSVITSTEPRVPYRTWFEAREGSRPLHVSAEARSLEDWLRGAAQPVSWSLGFAAVVEATYLWATPEARAALGEPPSSHHPPADPELEDFIEAVLKAKKARRAGDDVGSRWFARQAAELVPGLLRPLNAVPIVADRRAALQGALDLVVVPDCYPNDIRTCLGLSDASTEEVAQGLERLASEVLRFLRLRAPGIDPQPDLERYLSDGTLEMHLRLDGD